MVAPVCFLIYDIVVDGCLPKCLVSGGGYQWREHLTTQAAKHNALAIKAKKNDTARDELLRLLKNKVERVARHNYKKYPYFSVEEWENELYIRANDAITRFDPKKAAFETYLDSCFRYPIREKGAKTHEEKVSFIPRYEYERNLEQQDIEHQVAIKDVMIKAERTLRAYNPLWWLILRNHFINGQTLHSLAKQHKTTKKRIQGIIDKSLLILRRRLDADKD